MAQTQVIPLMFPVRGIVRGPSFRDQEEGTCYDALNVRPHDSLERRRRGGQRTGQDKYFADPVNGANAIQAINSVVRAFDANDVVADQLLFEYDFTASASGRLTTLDPTNFPTDHNGSVTVAGWYTTTTPATSSFPGVQAIDGVNAVAKSSTASFAQSVLIKPLTVGTSYVIRGVARVSFISTSALHGIILRVSTSSDSYVRVNFSQSTSNGRVSVLRGTNASSVTLAAGTNFPITRTGSNTHSDPFNFEIRVNANRIFVYINNALIHGNIDLTSAEQANTRIGVGVGASSPNIGGVVNSIAVYTAIQPASLRSTDLVVVSAGTIYAGTPANGLLPSASGTGLVTAGRVMMQPAFQKMYFCDGLSTGYKVLDVAGNSVSTWTPTAESLPVGSVDATRACRLIALYRGRIVLSGLSEDPQNWFMARAGDPLDWDYTPATTDATQPVAGGNSEAGLLGDIVTCLAPYQDDLLFMGGDHTLWVMRGDPAAGGQIDNISRQVGIVGPEAFTWDFSRLYFLAQSGLYRVDAGGGNLEKIDRNRLDKVFDEIDYASNNIRLLYDRRWQGVHVFITPINEPDAPTDHWFWDERTDSFWRDQYPTNHGPTAVHLYDADDPDDRAVLLGGWDGYIRSFTDAAASDDGEAIESFVQFSPLKLQGDLYMMRLHELQMVMGAGGDDVTLAAYTGKSAEEAVTASAAQFSTTLVAGRNNSIRRRVRANTLMLKMSNNVLDQTWAFESGLAFVQQAGRLLKAR